jgi:hypothetical protein
MGAGCGVASEDLQPTSANASASVASAVFTKPRCYRLPGYAGSSVDAGAPLMMQS